MPHPASYRERFGGLTRAYGLVGFKPSHDYRFLHGFAWRDREMNALRDRIAAGLDERGLVIERAGAWLRLAVRYAHYRPIKGAVRWFGQYHGKPKPHWMLFARLNEAKTAVLDHCLITGGMTNYWLGGARWTPGVDEWVEASLKPLLDRVTASAQGPETEPVTPIHRSRT